MLITLWAYISTTATATKTSLRIRATLNSMALIPSRSLRQVLANYSGGEF